MNGVRFKSSHQNPSQQHCKLKANYFILIIKATRFTFSNLKFNKHSEEAVFIHPLQFANSHLKRQIIVDCPRPINFCFCFIKEMFSNYWSNSKREVSCALHIVSPHIYHGMDQNGLLSIDPTIKLDIFPVLV